MLAVRGGAPCVPVLRLLLSLPQTCTDLPSLLGSTALHMAASWGDQTATELLIRAGANPALKDRDGKIPAELVPSRLKDTQRKLLLSILRKKLSYS